LSKDQQSLATFAAGGFLIAAILIFSLVALPELFPAVYPQLRYGTVEAKVVSTSGGLVGPPTVMDMEVTITSMSFHRVGVGEGAWIVLRDAPVVVNPMELAQTPLTLEAKMPIGDYNLVRLTLGEVKATILGQNVTLKVPTQDLKIPTAFRVNEGKRAVLTVDLSFAEAAVEFSQRFDPYILVTVEQPGHAPLSTIASLRAIASLGPVMLAPGESKSSAFEIAANSTVQNYLVHAEGGAGADNTFEVEIAETGELWYDLSGNLWFLGGNLTAGNYTMNVYASNAAALPLRVAVNLYRVPRIATDLPDATFSGFVPSEPPPFTQVNEFALYFDSSGLYDFYLTVKSGDYEFMVDNNPASVASKDQIVTMSLDSGLHTFQIFADFSGSMRETSWTVGVVPVPSGPAQLLSREAMIATGLLVVALVLFVTDVTLRRLRRKTSEPSAGQE
jgi:hypothetical protein